MKYFNKASSRINKNLSNILNITYYLFSLILIAILLYNCHTFFNVMCFSIVVVVALDNLYKKNLHNITMIILLFIIMSILELFEYLFCNSLTKVLPFYYFIKLIVICILLFPKFKGFNTLYSNLLVYTLATNDESYGCRHKIKSYVDTQQKKYGSVNVKSCDSDKDISNKINSNLN